MTNSNQEINWMMRLIRLRELPLNWDGENSPVPSDESISKAKDIIDWINQFNLNIDSIEPDVLGGVAIYLNGINNRMAWVSILNNGKPCIVSRCRPHGRVTGRVLTESTFEELKSFLLSDEFNLW